MSLNAILYPGMFFVHMSRYDSVPKNLVFVISMTIIIFPSQNHRTYMAQ